MFSGGGDEIPENSGKYQTPFRGAGHRDNNDLLTGLKPEAKVSNKQIEYFNDTKVGYETEKEKLPGISAASNRQYV